MAELFQTTPQNITLHLKNIFEEGELADDFVAQIQSRPVTLAGSRTIF